MNARVKYLRQRRELLISQAAAQRSEVSYVSTQLQEHLRFVDMGLAIVKAIRSHPAMLATSASLLMPAAQNKFLRYSSRLFTAWKVFVMVRKQWPAKRQTS